MKAKFEKTLEEKNDACKDTLELDQAHRKLIKEKTELLRRHEQNCFELKAVKSEKEIILKENNRLSVALQASRKNAENKCQQFEKERNVIKEELEKLNVYKIEKEAEGNKMKKATILMKLIMMKTEVNLQS